MLIKPAKDGALYSTLKTFPKKPVAKDLLKEWCVYFNYLHNGTWNPIRRKGDINRIRNFKEKEKELTALKSGLIVAMDLGWNPVTKSYNEKVNEFAPVFEHNLSFDRAIDFALSQCDVSDNTKKAYRNCVKKIKKAASSLGFSHFLIQDIKRKHIKVILEKSKGLFKWSNDEYNKNLRYLQGVLSRLDEFEIIEYNPAHKIKHLPTMERAPKFVPYTQKEKEKIEEYLFLHHYGYYVLFMTLYHTGMRPMEVTALKIKDINLSKQIIEIVPDRKRKNSKTKKVREIQINEHLSLLLREWIKDIDNEELFVFGSVKHGKFGSKHPDYFRPSTCRIKRDTITRFWKDVIMDGLGINKHQYAAKHTGADDKLLAGISLEAIKEMFGHSNEFMTKRYQTVLKDIYRKEINEKSKGFL